MTRHAYRDSLKRCNINNINFSTLVASVSLNSWIVRCCSLRNKSARKRARSLLGNSYGPKFVDHSESFTNKVNTSRVVWKKVQSSARHTSSRACVLHYSNRCVKSKY